MSRLLNTEERTTMNDKKKKILWARKDWADSVCPPVIAENLYCKGHQAECSEGHWHIKENNLLWADG